MGVPASALGIISPSNGEPGTLMYKHPEYLRRWWYWEFGRVSYLGGREYHEPTSLKVDYSYPAQLQDSTASANETLTDNYATLLHRHRREDAADFANRRRRAYYFNFVGPVANGLVAHATKKPAIRKGSPDLEEWWEGVDEERTCSIARFVDYGAKWAANYGLMWACVDNSAEGDEDADGKPYCYWIPPLDIWDWHVVDGQIKWLKQFVFTEAERADWKAKVESVYRFRIWYEDRVETWECARDGTGEKQTGSRPNTLGMVPLIPMFSQRSQDYSFPDGTPIMGDLALVANSVYQDCSCLQQILGEQTFSQMVIPDAGNKLDKLQLGVNRFLGYDPQGASQSPEYLSPDVEQPRVLIEAIQTKLSLSRQMVGVGRGRSEGSMQVESADALELESEDKKAVLAGIAAECEDFERRLAEMFLAYKTAEPDMGAVTIQYPREFDMRGFEAEVREATAFQRMSLSPEVDAKLKTDLVERRWASLPREELDELKASIEAMPPPVMGLDKDGNPLHTPNQGEPDAEDKSGDGDQGPPGDKKRQPVPMNRGKGE